MESALSKAYSTAQASSSLFDGQYLRLTSRIAGVLWGSVIVVAHMHAVPVLEAQLKLTHYLAAQLLPARPLYSDGNTEFAAQLLPARPPYSDGITGFAGQLLPARPLYSDGTTEFATHPGPRRPARGVPSLLPRVYIKTCILGW